MLSRSPQLKSSGFSVKPSRTTIFTRRNLCWKMPPVAIKMRDYGDDTTLLEMRDGVQAARLAGPFRKLSYLWIRSESVPQLCELRSSGGGTVPGSPRGPGCRKTPGELLRVFRNDSARICPPDGKQIQGGQGAGVAQK